MTKGDVKDRMRVQTEALNKAGSLEAYFKTLPTERLEKIAENELDTAGEEECEIAMLAIENLRLTTGKTQFKTEELADALLDMKTLAALEVLTRSGEVETVEKGGKTLYKLKAGTNG